MLKEQTLYHHCKLNLSALVSLPSWCTCIKPYSDDIFSFYGAVEEHLHASSAIKTSNAFRWELLNKLQQFVLHMVGHKTIFQHGVECYAKLIALIIMVHFTQIDSWFSFFFLSL